MRRALDALATALALAGGTVLVAVAVLTGWSVTGRWLGGRPLLGDVELVQLGTAAAIALFLPYCQLRGSHLFVDFFTARASGPVQKGLDRFAALAAGVLFLALAWRAAAAVVDMYGAGETSMVLGIPLWMPYAAMVPGLALAALAGIVQSLASSRSTWSER